MPHAPWTRTGRNIRLRLLHPGGELKIYVLVVEDEHGQPIEISISADTVGSTIRGLLDVLGTTASMALERGASIGDLVAVWSRTQFEPAGAVTVATQPDLKRASSIVDAVARVLALLYPPVEPRVADLPSAPASRYPAPVPDPATPEKAIEQKIVELDQEIARLRGERELYARALAVLKEDTLTERESSVKGQGMIPATRVRHSQGRAKMSGEKVSHFVRVLNAAGHSIRSLAESRGCPCSYGLLSMASRGDASISTTAAEWVRDHSKSDKYPAGYEVTARNWPKLRQD